MKLDSDFIDEIKSIINSVDLVSSRVSLKKHGNKYQGLCPFHNEKSPSFTLDEAKGLFHCFGCGAGGDIIEFEMRITGRNFQDTVDDLIERYNIPIPNRLIHRNRGDNKSSNSLEIYQEIHKKAWEFFAKNANGDAIKYLTNERGLQHDIIKKFGISFAPNSWDNLYKFLVSNKFSNKDITDSGLVKLGKEEKFYDHFRNRIIFPIHSHSGIIIAFGGRVIKSGDSPKYLNSPETDFFKKNKILYNYHNAKKSILEQKSVIITEGYMDVISLANHNINNVVAPLGTAINENHLQTLMKLTDNIIVCFDGDVAGVNAAKKFLDIILPILTPKHNISFVILPDKLDPDDYIRLNGAENFKKLIRNGKPISETLLDFAIDESGIMDLKRISPERKSKLEMNLLEKANLIKNDIYKKYYTSFIKNSIWNLGRILKNKKTPVINLEPKKPKNQIDILELDIISMIYLYRDDIESENFHPIHFNNAEYESNIDQKSPASFIVENSKKFVGYEKEKILQIFEILLMKHDLEMMKMDQINNSNNDSNPMSLANLRKQIIENTRKIMELEAEL